MRKRQKILPVCIKMHLGLIILGIIFNLNVVVGEFFDFCLVNIG